MKICAVAIVVTLLRKHTHVRTHDAVSTNRRRYFLSYLIATAAPFCFTCVPRTPMGWREFFEQLGKTAYLTSIVTFSLLLIKLPVTSAFHVNRVSTRFPAVQKLVSHPRLSYALRYAQERYTFLVLISVDRFISLGTREVPASYVYCFSYRTPMFIPSLSMVGVDAQGKCTSAQVNGK